MTGLFGRTMRVCLIAVAAFAVFGPGSALAAEYRDGDALLQVCTATIGAEVDFCYGYIDAIVDYLLANRAVGPFEACIATDLDDSRVRDIVVGFLRRNPQLRHLGAAETVARAMAERFPCPAR